MGAHSKIGILTIQWVWSRCGAFKSVYHSDFLGGGVGGGVVLAGKKTRNNRLVFILS